MIRRGDTVYHLDSLPLSSGEGRWVFVVPPPLFVEYAQYYMLGWSAPGGREVGGLYRVYYAGYDYLVAEAHRVVG